MSRIALLVIGLTVLAVALRAGDCSGWQVEELLRAPDWYVRAVEDAHSINATQVEDSLWRTDYVLDLTKSFIYYRHDWQVDSLGWSGQPSALYFHGRDTVRLDTTFEGYGDITFYADSTKCAAYKIGAYYDDGSSGRVVIFYLESRITEVISLEVGATEVEFSSGGWLAYNDWADLWIYNSLNELVFKKGGSYARYGECMWQHIADIRWSPDGRSCVFKYYPGLATETQYELYEARLPGPGEESDTTVQK